MIEAKESIITLNESRQLNTRKLSSVNKLNNAGHLTKIKELNINRQLDNNNINFQIELRCPICGSTNIKKDYETLEYLCECGCVVDEDIIDFTPEWRNYECGNDKSRVGRPKSYHLHDGGLSTFISKDNKGISQKNIAQFNRIRRWHKRSRIHGNKERHLATALSRLNRMISVLSLTSSIRESSARYYRKSLDLGLIHGRSIDAIVASSIYISCKEAGISRTFDEIEEVSNVKAKIIAKNVKLLSRELNIKFKPTSPREYVPRFVSNLNLPKTVEVKSLEIISQITGKSVSGKPSALAAASIYLACKTLSIKVSQDTIAKSTGVSPVTIRKRYKLINEYID